MESYIAPILFLSGTLHGTDIASSHWSGMGGCCQKLKIKLRHEVIWFEKGFEVSCQSIASRSIDLQEDSHILFTARFASPEALVGAIFLDAIIFQPTRLIASSHEQASPYR